MEPGEKYLRKFQPPALPPDLKARVMEAAKAEMLKPAQAPDRGFFSTRMFWLAAAAMLVSLAANFIVDAMLGDSLNRTPIPEQDLIAMADGWKPLFSDNAIEQTVLKRITQARKAENNRDRRSSFQEALEQMHR